MSEIEMSDHIRYGNLLDLAHYGEFLLEATPWKNIMKSLIAQYYLPYEAKMVDFYGIESIINSEAIQTTGEYNERPRK